MGSSGERGFQWWYRMSNFSFRILCLKTSARNIIILVLSLFGNSSITLCRCSCCCWPCPSTHTVCSAGTCTPWPPCDVQEPLYCTPTHGVLVQVLHDPPVLCRCSCTVQYCTSTQYAVHVLHDPCVAQVPLEEPIVVAKYIDTRCTQVHVLHDPLCCAGAVGGADGGCQVHRQPPADQRSQVGPATVRAGHLLRPTHHLPLWGGTCQVTNGLIKVFFRNL